MQLYADMQRLEEVKAKNKRTKEIMSVGEKKIEVIEESQKFIMDMLNNMEKEMAQYIDMANNMRPRDSLYDDNQQPAPLHLQTDNQRLYHRLDTLCKDLHANDTLIGEALSKLHRMEQIECEQSLESQKVSDEMGA